MSEIDDELLRQLLEERDQLLAQYPELRPLQKEIDRTLEAAGEAPLARVRKSFEMLSDILTEELNPELIRLKNHIDKALSGSNLKSNNKRRSG